MIATIAFLCDFINRLKMSDVELFKRGNLTVLLLCCTLTATVQKADLLQVGVECDPNWSNLKSLRITPVSGSAVCHTALDSVRRRMAQMFRRGVSGFTALIYISDDVQMQNKCNCDTAALSVGVPDATGCTS